MIAEYKEGEYRGYRKIEFPFNGYTGEVIFPENARADAPWVWRAEFLGAFDTVDVEMLRRGWHLVTYHISDMFGNPASVALMKRFYDFIVPEFGLSPKCDIFGFSRGGLYSFNFTCAHPDCVSVLYLDAPVMNMRDWPCDDRYAGSFNYLECPKQYGMTREELFAAEGLHPVDRLEELYRTGVPVVLVAGAADTVVRYPYNSRVLGAFMQARGADYMEIIKPDCDHHPHSITDPAPVADFIEAHRK